MSHYEWSRDGGLPRTGHRPKALGIEIGGTWGETGQESSHCCGGTEAWHLAASVVGDGRSLRTPVQRQPSAILCGRIRTHFPPTGPRFHFVASSVSPQGVPSFT